MKKWISLLCVCMLVFGTITASVVSASADAERAETAVDVKKGDEVTYILNLDRASEPVVGTDFSFYYDSSVFELESVADYNDNTDPEEWIAVINPDLNGEVRGVWSILKGVDFSTKRHFITLNLKATDDANNTHITYRIRFLYGNNAFDSTDPKPYLETYEFTNDVLINGEKVVEAAPPEWNDTEPTENGKFVPSPDGKSENADTSLSGVVDLGKKNSNAKQQNAENNANAGNGPGNGANSANGGNGNANGNANDNAKSGSNATTAPPATTADGYYVIATDAVGNVTATSDQAPVLANADGTGSKGGSSPVLWIIIALVVLAGGGAAVYFYMKKKPSANAVASAGEVTSESNPASDAQGVSDSAVVPETEVPETETSAENVITQLADNATDSDDQ